MEPETRLLRYFLAVASELNFTRAAKQLHITQPTLSAQIRQLESQLGVTLLQRNTRSVSLTEAGRALADEGAAAVTTLERAWDAARLAGRAEEGSLRLAYPLSAAHDTAPQLVHALHASHPRITVTTEILPTPTVLTAVRDGRADAGLAREPAPLDGVHLQPIRRDPLGVLIADGHPLAGRDPLDLMTVATHPVVVHPRTANPAHYDFIVGLFTDRGVQPDLVERDIAFDFRHEFIVDGATVALVGSSSAQRLPPGIKWLPLAESIAVTTMLALAAVDRAATARRFQHVAESHALDNGWVARVKPAGGAAPHPGNSRG